MNCYIKASELHVEEVKGGRNLILCPTLCMIALEPYMREFCIHFKGDIRECTTSILSLREYSPETWSLRKTSQAEI